MKLLTNIKIFFLNCGFKRTKMKKIVARLTLIFSVTQVTESYEN